MKSDCFWGTAAHANITNRSDVVKKVHYAVILQSQLGPRSGEISLQEDRGVVSGYFALLGICTGTMYLRNAG